MKTSPLNASAHDVRAWLNTREDGTAIDPSKPTKTQHRVVVKLPKCVAAYPDSILGIAPNDDGEWFVRFLASVGDGPNEDDDRCVPIRLPYAVGDELWVRECWGEVDPRTCDDGVTYRTIKAPDGTTRHIVYRATGDLHEWGTDDGDEYDSKGRRMSCWKSSMHMPEWASRIRHRVTAVRVKRLRSVCASDAYAEGFPYPTIEATAFYHQSARAEQAIDWLRDQWNERSTNKDHPFESDPWVEVLETARTGMGNTKEER